MPTSMRLHPVLFCGLFAAGCVSPGKPPVATPTSDPSDPGNVDADGDGFPGADDCDDADASVYPSAVELCNGVDDNCNGAVDEGLKSLFFVDEDSDGYGDPTKTTEACNAPTGTVTNDDDCRDDDASVYPGAAELCNGIDDDCDGAIDEDIDEVRYADTDGDGFGDPESAVIGCEDPSAYVLDGTDCDDNADDVFPGAPEVCDGRDNNCNDEVDEGLTGTFYIDLDGDGWGSVADCIESCTEPEGYVPTSGDCNDRRADIHPGAAEICNGIDDDCDTDIDADDSDVDRSSGVTVYTDVDLDGFGDATTARWACEPDTGEVAVGTDCDDAVFAVNPSATEICNGIDDDCDTDIDDADSSLDTSTADTWYADTDRDGEGDPDTTALTCVQPSGYVDNGDDCDDTDATDTDGDGTQDCADDDIDGDGLSNDFDVAPDDDSITRGFTGGLGTDGTWTVAGTEVQTDWTLLSGGATSGDTVVTVDDASPFVSGDELLVLSQQGADAGQHQFVFIDTISGNDLTIEPPLDDAYDASSVILVQRVPHYTTVTIPGGTTLAADRWADGGGGVVIFRATDAVSIAGTISAAGAGFEGGTGVYGNGYECTQGESYTGPGASGTASANDGGGGCRRMREDNGDSGAGGGYASSGTSGTNVDGYAVTTGGTTYGDAALTEWHLGSGGGGGSPDDENDGNSTANYAGAGGHGGGFVALFSATSITVTGTLTCDGSDGDDGVSDDGEVGGGGAGSGGTLYLVAPTLALSGTVTSGGGSGGASSWHNGGAYGSAYGGSGGEGRVRLEYTTLSGNTSPTAGSTGSYSD